MRRLSILMLLLVSTSIFAQNKISGVIYLKGDGNPLAGVVVKEDDSSNYCVSNSNGEFLLETSSKETTLTFSGLGLKDLNVESNGKSDLGRLHMESAVYALSNAIVTSVIGTERVTPVSASTITGHYIEERLGSHEFTEILKYTPGVHANRQGGGWGDSEIYMRGFDNSNIAVLVNGIPINDMETGSVYWSDWANLCDVTATMQTQRGIGTSKVSTPSVGGTINIVTKGIHAVQGGMASLSVGSHGYNKLAFAINSGLMKNGWALSLLGSRTSGDGYFQGGDFEMYSYFINATKLIGDNHQLVFTGFGAPQKHYSRSNALTSAEWEKVRQLYNLKDWREFNPDYGFDSDGQRKTADYAEYHKPFVSLTHNWDINEKSKLNTNFFAAFGRGGSFSGKADERNFSEYDWYASDYGILNTTFRTPSGTYDYSKIESINAASESGSQLVMTQIDGKLNTYGITSTYSASLIPNLDFYGGVDMKYFVCAHTNRIIDLFGGDFYVDPCRQEVLIENNHLATDEWKNEHIYVGDVAYRDYDSHVFQKGIFTQLEYKTAKLSAFLSGSLSHTTYWKYDRFYHSAEKSRSKNANYWGGTIKAGANYNINKHHNVYLNGGFISRAPYFKSGAFMSATSSNVINDMAKNEKSATVELGYGFHNEYLAIVLNGYLTSWMDKSMTKKGKIVEQYYINMTGVNSRHMGVELEVKARPARWVDLNAMLSIGDWRWTSDKVRGYAYNLSSQAVTPEGEITTPGADNHAWAIINMKNIKVGGSAQTTAAFDAMFTPFDGLRIGGGYTFYGRNYAFYSLSGGSLKLGKEMFVSDPWEIPSYGCLDIRASYELIIGKQRMTFYCMMNNVLDSTYIEKAWNPSNVASEVKEVDPTGVYMFYGLGRNWNAGIKLNF